MHIGEDATGAGKRNCDNHQNLKDDAYSPVLDVVRKDDGNDKENCGDNHDVSGRPRRFTGAIRTSGENDEFVKNDVGDGHENSRHSHPGDFRVDFGEIFAFGPLI